MPVSWGCITKCHRLGCLKTTEICPLIALETGSPKPRCWKGHTPSNEWLYGKSLLAPSWRWLVATDP